MDVVKNIKFSWILFFTFCTSVLIAQNGQNPFELQYRADKKAAFLPAQNDPSNSANQETITNQNPFNVIRTPLKKTPELEANIPEASIPEKTVEEAGKVDDKNFKFWMTLVMLVLLTIVSTIYRDQLVRAYQGFTNENVLRMLDREKGTVAFFPYYILFSIFIFNLGFLTYLLLRHYGINDQWSNLKLLAYSVGGVGLLFIFKQLVINIIGAIFPVEKEASMYNLTITVFGIITGFVLFISNILIGYAPERLLPIFIFATIGIVGIIYFFRSIRGLSIASKFLNHNKFHFFIYLCSVELAPILILWKLSTTGIGV